MSAPSITPTGVLAAPPAVVDPSARSRIAAARDRNNRRLIVFDDDPTGSQCVSDVELITVASREAAAAALHPHAAVCFALTNTRSFAWGSATAVAREFADATFAELAQLGTPADVISRGDSMLRGHLWAEVNAIRHSSRRQLGVDFDAILFVPAFFEAGRVTIEDTHYLVTVEAGENDRDITTYTPVSETEFALDSTFGYDTAHLPTFLERHTGGQVLARDVLSVSVGDIRTGGPERVAEILSSASGGQFIVINALEYADLDVVALGALRAQEAGQRLLWRTAPSMVAVLAGQHPRPPLSTDELSATIPSPPSTPPSHPRSGNTHPDTDRGGGLVVVGSHVGLTSRQVREVLNTPTLHTIKVDVPALIDADATERTVLVEQTAAQVRTALQTGDVLLMTSRTIVAGSGGDDGLRIARTVSDALSTVVRLCRKSRPRWVIGKGGITSHDIAANGLGIEQGTVIGQLLPGMLTVLQPKRAPREVLGTPYVIFAGNVGNDQTLAHALDLLRKAYP